MKNKVVLLLFIVCSAWTATAQTVADSLALVAAHWEVTPLKKGVLCRKAFFNSLYGVPQEVSVLEITPKYYNLDVLIHQPKEETSVAAHRSGAIAAVNGSYFNMKALWRYADVWYSQNFGYKRKYHTLFHSSASKDRKQAPSHASSDKPFLLVCSRATISSVLSL